MKAVSITIVIGLVLTGLGYSGISFLLRYISETEVSPSIIDITEIGLNYFSIFVTIVLGIIVYLQAERVNKLEAAQLSIFLGVEKLDYSRSLGTTFLELNPPSDAPSDIRIFQITDQEQLGFFGNISLGGGSDRIELPLIFGIRSIPLITSIQIKRIELILHNHHTPQRPSFSKSCNLNLIPIYRFMPDGSEFDFCFVISRIEKSKVEKIAIKILLGVEDQFSRNHLVETVLDIEQKCEKIHLVSSKSIITEV
jgi:hypothetical protein